MRKKMKKVLMFGLLALLMLSGCDTYTGTGAYVGTSFGGILGSAIGGISGGPRGSDVGTIIGMASGAVIGSAIGHAKDVERERDYAQYEQDKAERAAARARRQAQQENASVDTDDQVYSSGFDSSNNGDDRLYDFNSSDYTGNYSARQPETVMPMQSGIDGLESYTYTPDIEIRNARFVDSNQDGQLSRGEIAKIIFEVMNRGSETIYDVQPTVVEASGNRQIYISPNMHIESIQAGKGIRYTAMIKAGNRLKDGTAKFCVSAVQGGKAVSKISEFNIPTRK